MFAPFFSTGKGGNGHTHSTPQHRAPNYPPMYYSCTTRVPRSTPNYPKFKLKLGVIWYITPAIGDRSRGGLLIYYGCSHTPEGRRNVGHEYVTEIAIFHPFFEHGQGRQRPHPQHTTAQSPQLPPITPNCTKITKNYPKLPQNYPKCTSNLPQITPNYLKMKLKLGVIS